MQTKPTAFFMFPKVAKNACGFAHKQTPSLNAAWLLSLALARGDLAGISHIFARHTPDKRRSSKVLLGCTFLPSFLLFVVNLEKKDTSWRSPRSPEVTGVWWKVYSLNLESVPPSSSGIFPLQPRDLGQVALSP